MISLHHPEFLRNAIIQVERRTHPHLRAIFNDARIRIDHFFGDSESWAGSTIDYLALRVVHEAYPHLSTQDVRTLVAAIERQATLSAVEH